MSDISKQSLENFEYLKSAFLSSASTLFVMEGTQLELIKIRNRQDSRLSLTPSRHLTKKKRNVAGSVDKWQITAVLFVGH